MQGIADAYVYPAPGTNRWDTCAPEALLRLRGGVLTDMRGQRLVYDPKSSVTRNESLVAALDPDRHGRIIASLNGVNKM
jgi:3'-phosphoadenosine 5'-phosphosulfate (PAPS) 3'-phosphatase